MLREKNSELTVGIFILIAFFALLFVTVQTTSLNFKSNSDSIRLNASFSNINGLRQKAPVRIAGVKIGEVSQIKLNSKTYQADITIVIYNDKVQIPTDSVISILTEGVVGSKFISIDPGYDEEYLKNGQSIDKTKPSLAIEEVINEAIAIFATKE